MTEKILLGFEVKTGKPVHIGLHHLAIFGMTQLSGKTTTLEALISRSGLRAIAFKTKRGEAGFHAYNHVSPYYKARSDWQYVEGLVSVALGEKVRFEPAMRWSIMKACEGAKDLKQVQENAKGLSLTVRAAIVKQALEKLVAYLTLVIPELEKWTFTDTISLLDGVNVMDLEGMRIETQQLVLGSTIQYAFETLTNVVVIIPEAWEMMPETRMTPVKLVAEQFIRKGASIGNYLWIDSQDIGGVSKVPLRQCDNWIMGRMREAHEVERILKQLLGVKIPKEEIQNLKLGHFYAVIGDKVKKVYVLPMGVPEGVGRNVATGVVTPEFVRDNYLKKAEVKEDLVEIDSLRKEMEHKTATLVSDEIHQLEGKIRQDLGKGIDNLSKQVVIYGKDITTIADRQTKLDQELRKELVEIKGALKGKPITLEPKPSDKTTEKEEIHLEDKELVITVTHTDKIIDMTTDDVFGRIMLCALKDLNREGFDENDMSRAMDEHGWHMDRILVALNMSKLAKIGRLLKITTQRPYKYRLPSKLTVNVKELT
jgi:hypothetical protein